MGLVRGDLTVMALAGDYGKPRPVVILQSDLFLAVESVIVVPLSSDLRSIPSLFRLRIEPSAGNGLRLPSDMMVDKLSAVARTHGGEKIGHLEPEEIAELTAAVALFLGF